LHFKGKKDKDESLWSPEKLFLQFKTRFVSVTWIFNYGLNSKAPIPRSPRSQLWWRTLPRAFDPAAPNATRSGM
jgi:hypothetical protein